MTRKMAIVGAGMAGLSAGVYARLCGFEVDIYESHGLPGGLCTAWKRNGFTFDGCIHWLVGSRPGSPFNQLWEEVGALQGRTIVDPDAYSITTGPDGRVFTLYADADRLERHMLELSPEDAVPTRHFCELIRTLQKMNIRMDKAPELFGLWDIVKMVVAMRPVGKAWSYCGKISVGEFAARFKDPLIRQGLELFMESSTTLMGVITTMAQLCNRDAGYPLGGSLPFAQAIAQRCTDLGGRIHYKHRVTRVLVEGNRACGLELEDGSTVKADIIISAADLRNNLDHLLQGRFPSPRHERLFREFKVYPSGVQVSFGLNRIYKQSMHAINQQVALPRPICIADQKVEWLTWKHYNADPTLAPEGKSVITVLYPSGYDWWKNLRNNTEAYRNAKEEIARLTKEALEPVLHGFSNAVETVDVATPLTFERYTSSFRGSFMTWIMPKGRVQDGQMIPKTVPGLEGFYMVGMWMMAPGGLPTAVKTARDAVQIICRKERVPFNVQRTVASRAVA